MTRRPVLRTQGFTLIELVVTLALVGIVALTALPLYEVTMTRMRETELRAALRTLRNALDAYKAAADTNLVAKGALESGYPPSLDVLVAGVDAAQPPAAQWATRRFGSPPDDPQPGADVFDVASRSARVGSNGVPYKEW
jgi:general secretion pathway protein G